MTTSNRTVNGVPLEEILHPREDRPELVEWISKDPKPPDLTIVEPDPRWPEQFDMLKARIVAALEPRTPANDLSNADTNANTEPNPVKITSISHFGSTSVPSLPAKNVIDIDLVLTSNTLPSEPFYVPHLEGAGFQFILRNRDWHEQRLFRLSGPDVWCNLHVWGEEGRAEVERHRIFRDWLRGREADREVYARVKRECARVVREGGGDMQEYSERKGDVIGEIYGRAFKALGYLDG